MKVWYFAPCARCGERVGFAEDATLVNDDTSNSPHMCPKAALILQGRLL